MFKNARVTLAVLFVLLACCAVRADDGVFLRFKLVEPTDRACIIRLGGYIHNEPWYLPKAVLPAGADKDRTLRVQAGQWSPWLDLKTHAGKLLHGRLNRSGGVAEFPCVTAAFVLDPTMLAKPQAAPQQPPPGCKAIVELATAARESAVVKRMEETFNGGEMCFLVSPALAKDKDDLETLSQMQARHLAWAREASGGKRVSPKELVVQTSFWRATAEGAEVLHLLGFNVVGNQTPAVHEKYPHLRRPGHAWVDIGPAVTQEQADKRLADQAKRHKEPIDENVPFNFSDEVSAGRIGKNPAALAHFRAWLAERKIAPADLGVSRLEEAEPIETPPELAERAKANAPAARRVFYYTSRFRQQAGTQRLAWHTQAFRKHFTGGGRTSTLVADHPYFGGTGLGMGMHQPNTTWGGWPLALDWFDIARSGAVDWAGIEDWMGLQYMYGPNYTWEGFQLMGFQAAIFRSASRGWPRADLAAGGRMPIQAWITPSDETNLRLKSASALCQGAKHFFYWTYGPTCFGTENYWSDLRGEYDGIAKFVRHLAFAERVISPGAMRKTRLAMLYSLSSDLWQPYGYIHMLERRATYLALVHDQHLVDFLTEQDVEAGRLRDYDVLYVTDPCVSRAAAGAIKKWTHAGGTLYGACGAASRNEFNEPCDILAGTFGIGPKGEATVQEGEYRVRGRLNDMKYTDEVRLADSSAFGCLGARIKMTPADGIKVVGTFKDGSPAVVANAPGRGRTVYYAACPGLSYLKDAKFVPAELKERYPPLQRRLINAPSRDIQRPVELSHPVVEAGVYDSPAGTALVLANFTYVPIENLTVRLALPRVPKSVRSAERGDIKFKMEQPTARERTAGLQSAVRFYVPLDLEDIVLIE